MTQDKPQTTIELDIITMRRFIGVCRGFSQLPEGVEDAFNRIVNAQAATLKRDGFVRVTEPGAIVDISSPNACVKISAPLAYVKITGLSCVVEVAGVCPPPDRDWERVLRASVPYRWKPTVSAVGAAQSYIAELEAALEGLLAHSYAEQCQECGIGRSPPWLQAREALEP